MHIFRVHHYHFFQHKSQRRYVSVCAAVNNVKGSKTKGEEIIPSKWDTHSEEVEVASGKAREGGISLIGTVNDGE